jgi:alanine racemase
MDLTYLEISKSALVHNIHNFKSIISENTSFFAVVKSNAYGHGLKNIIESVYDKVDGFAVNSLQEALDVKKLKSDKIILIMGYIPLSDLPIAIENNFHFVLYNRDNLSYIFEYCIKNKKTPHYHLKIETGTGRQGICQDDLQWYIDEIRSHKNLYPAGIYTHFANIEDTTKHQYAMSQLKIFNSVVERFKLAGIEIPLKHTACSAAALLFPESHFNLVRVGISLYGYWPSRETYLSFSQKYPRKINGFLKPALSLKTHVCQIKHLPKGSYIGYGLTYKTTYDSVIAVLPVGYYEGMDRRLSNSFYALIKGERAPVRGRICMNICMIDITHIPDVELEDEVILIGSEGEESITADMIADFSGSINYEVLTSISPSLPRYTVD